MFHNKIIICALLLWGCTFICASQLSVSLAGADIPTGNSPVVPNLNENETTTSTTPAPKTTSSTPSTSTTTTTTTTTVKPTTTPTTTSTTPTPTTTSTTTTTTSTEPPKTTTVAPVPPPTTPAPGPYPAPTIGSWNCSCIALKMAAQLNFTYETKDNKTAPALYNIPADSKVEDCHCDNTTQTMQLNWGPAQAQHSFLLQFDMKNNTAQMTMIRAILPLIGDNFPNAKENETIQLLHFGTDFDTPAKMSYHCTRAQKFNVTEMVQSKEVIGTITVSDVQVEAFRPANATGFSTVHDCDSSQTSDVVPIAVGIALAALIVIVLISYLCARRRSTSRGYMSF